MNITNIQVTLKSCFDNFCASFWDNEIKGDEEGIAPFMLDYFVCFKTPAGMLSLFQEGAAYLLLGSADVQRIEYLDEHNLPYIITIIDEDEIFAVINGRDVCY